MNDRRLDLKKHQLAEVLRTDAAAELSEAELSHVSGGGDTAPKASGSLFSACCTGKHIATGKITI